MSSANMHREVENSWRDSTRLNLTDKYFGVGCMCRRLLLIKKFVLLPDLSVTEYHKAVLATD
jgi:hypothetical protein